jgi:hypothetical protein
MLKLILTVNICISYISRNFLLCWIIQVVLFGKSPESTTVILTGMKYDYIWYNSTSVITEFKYFGKTVTNQNVIHNWAQSILHLGCACCHSVHNILFPCNLKMTCCLAYWSLTARQEHRLSKFDNILGQSAEHNILTEETRNEKTNDIK